MSWGDELLASEVIRRCASRDNRPAIQCSCPRVAERLGTNASKLDDTVLWLATPPVAAANYIRAHSSDGAVHITYAGACPGAIDASIDQRVTPTELLLEITSRGIDVGAQPTVFENIIPPDRRRHFSASAGSPDPQRLWEASAFRIAQPGGADLAAGVAQLLLGDDRVLVDLAPAVGCICRAPGAEIDPYVVLRSPSPIVRDGVVDVTRAAPAMREHAFREAPAAPLTELHREPPADVRRDEAPRQQTHAKRATPAKPVLRRSGAWRRQTPRPGAVVARPSAVLLTIPDKPSLLQRTEVRMVIAAAIMAATLLLGLWLGRKSSLGNEALSVGIRSAPSGPRGHSPAL